MGLEKIIWEDGLESLQPSTVLKGSIIDLDNRF